MGCIPKWAAHQTLTSQLNMYACLRTRESPKFPMKCLVLVYTVKDPAYNTTIPSCPNILSYDFHCVSMVSIHISLLALYRSLRRHGNRELPNDYRCEPTGEDWIQAILQRCETAIWHHLPTLIRRRIVSQCALVGGLNVHHRRHATHNPLYKHVKDSANSSCTPSTWSTVGYYVHGIEVIFTSRGVSSFECFGSPCRSTWKE